jgi:hypothetical protein
MNHSVARFLIFSLFAVAGLQASDKWMLVKNIHGWSLGYPASWELYVMSSPDSEQEPSIQQSDNVNFAGPQGCYERKERCGLFQIYLDSVNANRHFDLKKYVDSETQDRTVISKEAAQLDGLPAYFIKYPEDQRLVIGKYKRFIFRISYGPTDHKAMDKTLEETFNRMMSSVKFKK